MMPGVAEAEELLCHLCYVKASASFSELTISESTIDSVRGGLIFGLELSEGFSFV